MQSKQEKNKVQPSISDGGKGADLNLEITMSKQLIINKKSEIRNPHCETRLFRAELSLHFGYIQCLGDEIPKHEEIFNRLVDGGYMVLPRGLKLTRKQRMHLSRMIAHAFFTPEQLAKPGVPVNKGKVRVPKSQKNKRTPKSKKSYARKSEDFLNSWEWRTLRYKVILKYGRRCMCCGASPDDGQTVIHVDHIKPRHTHPELALDASNLQVLCGVCNQGKGAWDDTDHRENQSDYEQEMDNVFQIELARKASEVQ